MFGSLFKAVIGVVVETPVAIVKDVATLGGALTDEDQPYTAQALEKVSKNLGDATNPEK